MSSFKHGHILFKNIMNILKIFFHSINVLPWIWIFKLFLLLLYLSIEFYEIKLWIYWLQFRFILCSCKMRLNLIKKRWNECLQKSSRQFDGIFFIDNNGKDNIIMYFIEHPKASIFYIFNDSLISFTIFGHLRMVSFYLVSKLKDLWIHITII